jgi:hypothetical protein
MAKTALFYARICPNLNCISIMMSFLTYIMGFVMNFELLPIFEEISIFSNGGHLGYRTALTDTI